MPAPRAKRAVGLTDRVDHACHLPVGRGRARQAVSEAARRRRAGGGLRRAFTPLNPAGRVEAGSRRRDRAHRGSRGEDRRGWRSRWARDRGPATGGRRGTGETGFSLVEVIIAFVVLLIVLVPVASVLVNSISQAATARQRLTALSLAEQYLELLNNTPFGAGKVNETPTITSLPKIGVQLLQKAHTVRSSVAYTIYAKFSWASAQGAPDLCTSGSTPKVIGLQVRVTWSRTTRHITDTTVLNYPPAGLATYGFLAVQVNGDPASGPPADAGHHSWSTRVQAVPVKVQSLPGTTPTTSETVYPNTYGCAFEQVPPGSYTVSLADPTPGLPAGSGGNFGSPATPTWVANADETTGVTRTPLTVSAGGVMATTFQYDEGSLVTLRYPSTTATDGLVTCPAAGSILCLVSGQAPATSAKPSTTPVAELSVLTSSGWTVTSPEMSRVAGMACAGTTRCLAVGYGVSQSTGVPYADSVSSRTGSPPSFTQDSVPSGVGTFDTITCPSGGATCYAVGTGTGGSGPMLLSATVTDTGVAWTADSAPALKGVSSIACPGATTCFATASTATGPVVLSLSVGDAWVADSLPSTPTTASLTQVVCPGTTTCYAIGATSSGPEVLSLSSGTTWVADTLPTGVTVKQLTSEACPTTSECYAIGSASSGSSTVGAVLSLTGTTSWVLDTAPVTAGLSSLVCPTSTVCVATGSTTSAPILLSRSGSSSWSKDSMSLHTGTDLDSVSVVGCSPAGQCDAVGTASAGGTTEAVILSLGSGSTWTENTLPTGKAPVYLTGVACGTSTCAAPGATETGALYLDGTVSGTSWTAGTPSSAQGMYVSDAPVAISDPNLRTTSILVDEVPTTPSTDLAQIGPLFPFSAGYSVAAAACSTELTAAAAAVTSTPGATASATLPLGLLPLKVVTPTGVPVSGATVTAAVTDPRCVPLHPISGGSDPASYSLESTGPLGLSAIAVIYDTYKVTVHAPGGYTASVVVQVTPTATVVGGVTQPLPSPVVVAVT